jgi:hypothetical protein
MCVGAVRVWALYVCGRCACVGAACVWALCVCGRCACVGAVRVWALCVCGRCALCAECSDLACLLPKGCCGWSAR